MGLCSSTESPVVIDKAKLEAQKKFDKQVNVKVQEQAQQDSQIKKLLLLGAGESGKSTLFKQVQTIYGTGYTEKDRRNVKSVVYSNTILGIKTLVKYSDILGFPLGADKKEAKEVISELKNEGEISTQLAEYITLLWSDPNMKLTWQNRHKYQIPDSSEYFITRVFDIARPDYIPSYEDMLRTRVRTTGIVETHFTIEGHKFHMFDVGGQRNERKKWIHCFDAVTAVIFVCAISEYDQMCFEDDSTNRIVESLNLFEELCNSKWFRDVSMILFLNKRDLFDQKILTNPIKEHFKDYEGGNDIAEGYKYFEGLFEAKNRVPDKEIYTHVTCATDQRNIEHVFNATKDIIIRKSLRDGGLM